MNLVADFVNIPTPQFMGLGINTINKLDKGARIWIPATIVRRPMDVAHWSAPDHIYQKTTAVGDAVSAKSDYTIKLILKIGRKISNLSAKRMQGVDHLWT